MPTLDQDKKSKIIRDGEIVRVPLILMDELQRSIHANRLHDGMGNAAGFKPGFVFATGLDVAPSRDAHNGYEQFISDAWRDARPESAGAPPARATRSEARRAYVDQLTDAWRSK